MSNYRVQPYQDEKGEWRWRRIAGNNRIVAVSGEGYVHKEHAVDQATEFFPNDELDTSQLPDDGPGNPVDGAEYHDGESPS